MKSFLLAILFVAFQGTCSLALADDCVNDMDCPGEIICDEETGQCLIPCTTADDCREGEECIRGGCMDAADDGGGCGCTLRDDRASLGLLLLVVLGLRRRPSATQ